jgi:hypothetical protein
MPAAARVVVSTHCSVRMPHVTTSPMFSPISSCWRFVVWNASNDVFVITGSPSAGSRPSIRRT